METTAKSNPWPPVCKLAAQSMCAVGEPLRDAVGDSRYRLVAGSLPYFSGVLGFRQR